MSIYQILISEKDARQTALNEAHIEKADFVKISLEKSMGMDLYQIDYCTDFMEYCCCVDAETGKAVGFDCRPRDV